MGWKVVRPTTPPSRPPEPCPDWEDAESSIVFRAIEHMHPTACHPVVVSAPWLRRRSIVAGMDACPDASALVGGVTTVIHVRRGCAHTCDWQSQSAASSLLDAKSMCVCSHVSTSHEVVFSATVAQAGILANGSEHVDVHRQVTCKLQTLSAQTLRTYLARLGRSWTLAACLDDCSGRPWTSTSMCL
jgi:hypothetical protein